MASTTADEQPTATARHEFALTPARSTLAASRTALGALILRDLVVLRKNFAEFVVRTVIQPFLLVFVFLYVFPTIGQGIGDGGGRGSVAESAFGLLLGTAFEPRNIGLMFGFVVLPLTFLGGTYYQWTRLAPVQVGGFHWLQTLVLVNPLIYVAEGMRAALTEAQHMPLYVIYPVLVGFCALFLTLGLRSFRRRVLV